jgi:YidC/Oxa1 family membrane protein insertase
MVMTTPDLQNLHLKRSMFPVHYVYLFHAMCSTHMVYRKGAFDAYDTVLCVGPHHWEEIRKTEEVYGLKPKRLIEHGYARLDAIMAEAQARPPFQPSPGRAKRIVVAPSWGQCSMIEQPCGQELIQLLLDDGHQVTLRLHPMTVRHFPQLPGELQKRFGASAGFRLELEMKAQESLQQADLMISDWSGAALEFALGTERPVVFIDTEPKVNNPNYKDIPIVPMEVAMRQEIGAVVSPRELTKALDEIQRVCGNPGEFRERIRSSRRRWIYNPGASIRAAADAIYEIIQQPRVNAATEQVKP